MNKTKLIFIIFFMSVFYCFAQDNKTMTVTISGSIMNHYATRNIHIVSAENETYLRGKNTDFEIVVTDDGVFNSSLELPLGAYSLQYYTSTIFLDLSNGDNLKITFDALDFINTISFSGHGYELNQLRADERRLFENATDFYTKNEIKDYSNFINTHILEQYDILFDKYIGILDQDFLNKKKESKKSFFTNPKWILKYKSKLESDKSMRSLIGKKAPVFSYINFEGKTVKLSDFLGKNVIIDLWATWCGACLYQFPFYEKVQEQFKNENIIFISISTDKREDIDKWKQTVEQKKLKGIQLFEGQNNSSEFIEIIKNNSIPRYILIDHQGKFVNLNLPKPITSDLEYYLINFLEK